MPGVGVGVAVVFSLPVPVLLFVFIFEFLFLFWLLRLPRRPRRRGAGVAGGSGPAEAGGAAIVGSAGATGSATAAGVTGFVFRDRARREAPLGVTEHTCVAPGTVVSVKRSPDFFARMETITGGVPGCAVGVVASSPNCIATPV